MDLRQNPEVIPHRDSLFLRLTTAEKVTLTLELMRGAYLEDGTRGPPVLTRYEGAAVLRYAICGGE